MRKFTIAFAIIVILALLFLLIYTGYKNYKIYSSYFAEADQYGVAYNSNDYIILESEIIALEEAITKAKEEARIEEERIAAEEAKKAEEERIAAEKAEEERIAAEKAAQEEAERLAKEQAEKEKQEQLAKEGPPSECTPYYVDGILLVNKNHCIPSSYGPGGLTSETYNAVQELISDAANEGIYLYIVSGYRSYDQQVSTFNYWVNTLGYEEAIKVSAEPGYSEHQTGLALDIGATSGACELEECFGDMPEGQWVANHAHEYGFIIRYPQGKESVTGYSYEPWHLCYVGVDVATYIYNNNLTLEEYLGVY